MILWTPRWTEDTQVGGSHFFEYKDKFLELPSVVNERNIVFRPHPMAFQNYIWTGRMTEAEVEDFKKRMADSGIEFDKNTMVEETFKTTGILITDVSSIIIMFFLTGRPIIYCESPTKLCDTYNELMPGLYVAHNWDEVLSFTKEILNGNDYLRDTRHRMIKQMFGNTENVCRDIVDYLIADYHGNV